MKIVFIIVSVLFFCLFMLGSIFNLSCWVELRANDKHNRSVIPVIFGIFGCISFAIFPIYPLVKLCWLPLFLDVGCLPYTIGVSTYLLHDWWVTHPRFKVMELHSKSSDFKLVVNLYSTGQVRLRLTNLKRPSVTSTEPHWQSISNGGKWAQQVNDLILDTHQGKLTYGKIGTDKYIWLSSDRKTYFDNIDLERFTARQ